MCTVAVIFPGQGSQYIGMGKRDYDNYPIARKIFDEVSSAVGMDMEDLCFRTGRQIINQTHYAQLTVFTASISMYSVLTQVYGITPCVVAGHSMGLCSALVASGSISLTEMARFIMVRGSVMQKMEYKQIGRMCAVGGVGIDKIHDCCAAISSTGLFIDVSHYNTATQTVVAGDGLAMDLFIDAITNAGGKTTMISVLCPFHTPLMDPAAKELVPFIEGLSINQPTYALLSCLDGLLLNTPEMIRRVLIAQITSPSRWVDVINGIINGGAQTIIEVGPGRVLTNMLRGYEKNIEKIAFDDEKQRSLLLKTDHKAKLAGLLNNCLKHAVSTRNRNADNSQQSLEVTNSYKILVNLQKNLYSYPDLTFINNTEEEAIRCIQIIFDKKEVYGAERNERIDEINRHRISNAYKPYERSGEEVK